MAQPIEQRLARLETLVRQLQVYDRWGAGDPNGAVDAPMGATYKRTDTGAVYRKTTGAGSTAGWVTP